MKIKKQAYPCHAIHCQVSKPILFLDTTSVTDVPCNDETFRCTYSNPNNPQCISTNKICDGKIDCVGGSDEDPRLCDFFPHGERGSSYSFVPSYIINYDDINSLTNFNIFLDPTTKTTTSPSTTTTTPGSVFSINHSDV